MIIKEIKKRRRRKKETGFSESFCCFHCFVSSYMKCLYAFWRGKKLNKFIDHLKFPFSNLLYITTFTVNFKINLAIEFYSQCLMGWRRIGRFLGKWIDWDARASKSAFLRINIDWNKISGSPFSLISIEKSLHQNPTVFLKRKKTLRSI